MATHAKELEFQRELEVFWIETQSGIQYFYARQAIQLLAGKRPKVFDALNDTPLFWNTALSGLQVSAVLALGRVFDPDTSNHSVTRLLSLAQRNLDIFSKEALAERKRRESADAESFLDEYLKDVYVPRHHDIQRLKGYVAVRRKIYEAKYKAVRHQVFAHRSVVDRRQIEALFAKTSVDELQKLFTFLSRLHEVLWQLYHNGQKPVFRTERYSSRHILAKPSPDHKAKGVQEKITDETVRMLERLVSEA